MSYTPPSVGPAGLTVPSYDDILNFYEDNFRAIFGQNVYLGNDSADHQIAAIFALIARDCMQANQLAYNSRSPVTAVGAGLDGVVKNNGLTRKVPSFSTCAVVVSGTPGATVTNGVAQDTVFGNKWDLPTSVVIGGGGSSTVTAVCETLGAFSLSPGAITLILTPQAGWTGVTNAVSSVPGQPVEQDSQLRARQAISSALPSHSPLNGTIAGIAATLGVTRYNVAENPTSAVDSLGNPPHSITAVVEGGTDADVAQTIYNNRTIGCFTNPNPGGSATAGSRTVAVPDPISGLITNIGFVRPTNVPIFVTVNAHLLAGGTVATLNALHDAVVNYLNSLQIGELVSFAAVTAAAMSVNPNITRPIVTLTSIFTAKTASPGTTVDIAIQFFEVAQGVTGDVIVNSV